MVPRLMVLIVLASLTSNCATQGPINASNCAGWRAIYPSRHDTLSRGTIDQLLAHNEHGVAEGCWPAPNGAHK